MICWTRAVISVRELKTIQGIVRYFWYQKTFERANLAIMATAVSQIVAYFIKYNVGSKQTLW